MADTVVRVEGVSKRYQIGAAQPGGRSALRSLVGAARALRGGGQEFWALRDVSFEVRQGEVLGIVGRNGAGKSTLLKILSRITEPTSGTVRMRGRVRALLEVGTGFHPELTGRENIYLNGAILGMRRAEIDRKFDAIVAFAETEQFLDTPVKRYSSGMYMRLAFSIAAHLEPEILIVDEVLAVGDAAFQQKCLGVIGQVASQGRTVLFVSHNMGVVQALCTRAVLLRDGRVEADDAPAAAVARYLSSIAGAAQLPLAERTERMGRGGVRLTRIDIAGAPADGVLATGRPARFAFHVSGVRAGMAVSFTVYDQLGQPVTFFDSAMHGQGDAVSGGQGAVFVCEVDELPLLPGRYRINAAVACDHELEDHVEAAAFLDVEQGHMRGRPAPAQAGYGSLLVAHRWTSPA